MLSSGDVHAAGDDFFEKRVRPLLFERCHGCHSKQGKTRGGLLLDSRKAILTGGDSGPAIEPGQPDKSLLIQAIRYQNAGLHMPPKGKLPAGEIAILEEWVRRGAPFPDTPPGDPKRTIDLAQGRKFWSFQPLAERRLPEVRNPGWVRRPLDAFVLAEQEKHDLSPSPEASRRVLIRRVFFDLIGLPPAPEDVEAFVTDTGADAYRDLVEKLLADSRYGERWGRFWLDLARYCDVPEPWSDSKGSAWLYRDWVVRSINEDLPYDQFAVKQLAADLLPDRDPRDLAALGFLGLSPSYWKELKLAPDVIKTVVAEEWEERISAVTSTFLGLTVACARCHDHKFDPITQQDYYALAGIFASTRIVDRPLVHDALARELLQAREKAKAIQDQIAKLKGLKPQPPDAKPKLDDLQAQLDQLRMTIPQLDGPLTPAVDDAALDVLPDGPHKTQVVYRPGEAQDVTVQVRGNPANAGPVVPRRFLSVLSPETPRPFRQGSGRLELARAIVTEGGPLAARVLVNRVWKQHFGTGLVETASDFGSQGARPSHPELLDDLAARFVKNGWSLKWLHREILFSATYRQASFHHAAKLAIDPDNRWLWRMNRRRLDIEAWRDAMLAVTGTLSPEQGGPSLDLGDPKNHRRTLYGTVKRRELHDLLRLHDFPDPTAHSPGRIPTTTPLQQLFTLNSPFIQQQSAALAQCLEKEAPAGVEARVQRAYHLLYGRPAKERQVELAIEFLSPPSAELWKQYAQVLLGSNEFLFVD
jgi:hypothetical protein